MTRGASLIALLVLMIHLGACSLLQSDHDRRHFLWQQQRDKISTFNHWRVSARVAFSTPDESGIILLRWRQNAQNFDIRLSAPLGPGTLQVVQTATAARLVNFDGQIRVAQSAEDLLFAQLGFRIPIAQLKNWLLGLPGDTDDYRIDRIGLLSQATLAPWTVDFEQYSHEKTLTLPKKITLRGENIRMQVNIDTWGHSRPPINTPRLLIPFP